MGVDGSAHVGSEEGVGDRREDGSVVEDGGRGSGTGVALGVAVGEVHFVEGVEEATHAEQQKDHAEAAGG